jgi:hypothetical protein
MLVGNLSGWLERDILGYIDEIPWQPKTNQAEIVDL